MVTIVYFCHWNYCSWSYQLACHLAVFLEFSLEKATGFIISAHYISGIFNEVTLFSEVIFWHIQVTYTFYGAIGEHKTMWWTELYNFYSMYFSVRTKALPSWLNTCLLWTVVYYNRKEIFPLSVHGLAWSWSAQVEYKGLLLCLFLLWDVAMANNTV